MTEKPEKTGEKVAKPGTFQKGEDPRRNLEGRPAGVKNFKTIFEEAVKKIAKEKEIDPDSVEVDLVIKAIAGARGGDYRYYKDIFDRIYGMPQQPIEHSGGITQELDPKFEKIILKTLEERDKKEK